MIFKVISHFFLNKTHLITGSSIITSSEYLAEKTAVFGRINGRLFFARKNSRLFGISSIIQLNITPLEHYPILASLNILSDRLFGKNTFVLTIYCIKEFLTFFYRAAIRNEKLYMGLLGF